MRRLLLFLTCLVAIAVSQVGAQTGCDKSNVCPASGGSGPTVVGTTSCAFSFSSPTSCSFGTVQVNDIVFYTACPNDNSPTITVSISGAAASGGVVVDIATANQGSSVAGSCQSGHFVITTAGTATITSTYSGGTGGTTDGNLNGGVLRSSTGL